MPLAHSPIYGELCYNKATESLDIVNCLTKLHLKPTSKMGHGLTRAAHTDFHRFFVCVYRVQNLAHEGNADRRQRLCKELAPSRNSLFWSLANLVLLFDRTRIHAEKRR